MLISYLLTEIVSSSRNQLSQPALTYATASLLPPCPRSPFSFLLSLSPVIFVGIRWRRVRRGSPSSLGPRPLETFAHGLSLQAPSGGALVCPSLATEKNAVKYLTLIFSRGGHKEIEMDEKAGAFSNQKRRDAADPPRSETKKETDKEPTRSSLEHAR